MKKLFPLFLLIVLACSDPSTQQEKTPSAQAYAIPRFEDSTSFERMRQYFPIVDQLYKDYAEKNHFPAISYGIVAGGQLIHSGNVGLANVGAQVAANSKTLFRIASMSKSFTAMAILKLRDEGKLSLVDPVTKYIPEFKGAGSLTADAPAVTIQNLLTMAAGFPEDNPWGDRQLDDTDEELLQLVGGGLSLSNVPGVAFEYSNLGFGLLGRIVTVVSGMPYQVYITENIMKPIGMTDSKWEYGDVPKEQLALGYQWEDGTWKEVPLLHDGAYGAMGGLICSVEDYAKYIALHLSAWPPRNEKEAGPVRRSSIREMHQPGRVNRLGRNARPRNGAPCQSVGGYGYGLGWALDCIGQIRIAHSGGLPGFGSEWRMYPEYGFGIVSFSNHTYGAPGAPNSLAADTLIALAGLKPRMLPVSAILEKRKEAIVKLIPDWQEVDLELFAENFFDDESLEKRKLNLQQMVSDAGDFLEITPLIPENQLRGSFRMHWKKKTIEVYFTLTPEREARIQQLDFEAID